MTAWAPTPRNDEARVRRAAADTPTWRALRSFSRHRLAVVSAGVLLLAAAAAALAPLIAPYDPYDLAIGAGGEIAFAAPPSDAFLLGTDAIGRDVLSRLIFGGRVSLTIGFVAALVAITVGSVLGLVAGWFGGWTDRIIARGADAVATFPALFLILTLSSFIAPSVVSVIVIIGFLSWMPAFRLMRAEVLKLRTTAFVEAAHALGGRNVRIMAVHLLPNAFPPLVVQATLAVADAILTESALSFLGLGVQPPMASWGNMLADARSITALSSQPWLWLPPGLAIFVTVLCINFLGDGLRAAVNPKAGSGQG
jgi:peptide/nickel transport system permease protein